MDTQTGTVLELLADDEEWLNWVGPYLIARKRTGRATDPKYEWFCIDSVTESRVSLPEGVSPLEVHPSVEGLLLCSAGSRKNQSNRYWDEGKPVYKILRRNDDRFDVVSETELDCTVTWLGQDNLLVGTAQVGGPPPFLQRLEDKYPWLAPLLPKSSKTTTARVYTPDGSLLREWPGYVVRHPTPDRRSSANVLVLAHQSGGSFDRLEGYVLPLKFTSPLWSRAIGLATTLFVALAMLRQMRKRWS